MNKPIPVTDTELVYKDYAGGGDGLEFVMSDETVDLMDDVILSDGWDLSNFKSGRNPIALFGHDSSFPDRQMEECPRRKQAIDRRAGAGAARHLRTPQ